MRRVADAASAKKANPFESCLHAIALDVPGLDARPQVTIREPGIVARPDFVDVEPSAARDRAASRMLKEGQRLLSAAA